MLHKAGKFLFSVSFLVILCGVQKEKNGKIEMILQNKLSIYFCCLNSRMDIVKTMVIFVFGAFGIFGYGLTAVFGMKHVFINCSNHGN